MTLQHEFAETFIIVEFALVAIIIVMTCILRVVLNYNNIRKARMRAFIENQLTTLLTLKQPMKVATYRREWRRISMLVPILFNFDKKYSSLDWEILRTELLYGIILPLARKAARRPLWSSRYFAAEAFSQAFEPGDEATILKLVKDRVPLVSMHAIPAALNTDSEEAVNAIITIMSKLTLPAQITYLRAFGKASVSTQYYVERRLRTATEPAVRAVCYSILLKYPATDLEIDTGLDLRSDNLNLRVAAINYIVYIREKNVSDILTDKLNDPDWQVKVVVLHHLKTLRPEKALVPTARLLNDPEWWVRLSAAEVLKSYGKEGTSLLGELAPKLARTPTEAIHVSNIWW